MPRSAASVTAVLSVLLQALAVTSSASTQHPGVQYQRIANPVVGCSATVSAGGHASSRGGLCTDIKSCLLSMPADCAVNTLELLPGVHSGANNTEVGIASNASVALVGHDGAKIDGGGATWLLSVVGLGSLTLTNLTLQRGFLPDFAGHGDRHGAALSVVGMGTVRATGVQFVNNEAAGSNGRGGAVFLIDNTADANDDDGNDDNNNLSHRLQRSSRWLDALFVGCTWEGNRVGSYAGGGVYIGLVSPRFLDCTWRNNSAGEGGYGGGLVWFSPSATMPAAVARAQGPAFVDCTWEFNSCGHNGGGGGACIQDASPSLVRCTWRHNFVSGGSSYGGGLELNGDSAETVAGAPQSTLVNCTWVGNSAGQGGGGTYVQAASPCFSGCTWHANTVFGAKNDDDAGDDDKLDSGTGFGGGLDLHGDKMVEGRPQSALVNCTFEFNRAGDFGGGMYVLTASPTFVGCIWRGNSLGDGDRGQLVGGSGGGLMLNGYCPWAPQSALDSCTFEDNAAGHTGGGANMQDASPSFANCRWHRNFAYVSGGGLSLFRSSSNTGTKPSALTNCVFAGNRASQDGGAVYVTLMPGLLFIGVDFLRNEATQGSGGGVRFALVAFPAEGMVQFAGCRFDSNRAPDADAGNGGGVSFVIYPKAAVSVEAPPPAVCVVTDTAFLNNSAGATGGAVAAEFPPDTPANLRFLDDSCSGAVCSEPDSPSANTPPTSFATKTARRWHRAAVLNLTNLRFERNSAANSGGALAINSGVVALVNVTMANNVAGEYGGALYLDGTASLSAFQTTWVRNKVNTDRQASSAEGQHIYAGSGGGEWNFSGGTAFEHADTNAPGLSAAKIDGVHGLTGEAGQSAVVVACPAGAVQTDSRQWVSNFMAASRDWRLEGGETTQTTTGAFWAEGYQQLPTNRTTKNNTRCQAAYFANWKCGNPPPVYPSMVYMTTNLGCKQCSRSEAALPVGGQRAGNSSQCEPCPEAWIGSGSATCDSGHVVQAPGWWRPEAEGTIRVTKDTRFWECYTHEAACLGSANTTAGAPAFDALCAPGHTGPVCALCLPGFAMVHSVCKLCPPGAWAAIGSAAALAVFGIGSIAILYYNRKRLGMTKKVSSIKIIVGFYSLLAVVEQTFAIAWPAGFQRVLSNVKAAFASVLDLSSFACAVHVDWFHKVGFWCLALIAVLVALVAAFRRAVSKFHVASAEEVDGIAAPPVQPHRKSKVVWLVTKLFGAQRPPELEVEYCGKAFNVMLLVYPFLSPAAVAVFDCRKVAGTWYLEADYSLRCFDSRWLWWATVSVFVSVFYVLGLPCLALFSVIRRSPSIEFISAGYRTDGGRIILGWEVVEMLRKFLLTSAVIFWPKGSCIQVAVAVMVSMFFLAFQMYHMPYDTRADNWFQVLALVGLLLVYFMGLLIKVQPHLESRYGFDAILQLVSGGVAAITVAVPIIHKARLKWRARGRARSGTMIEFSEPLMNDKDRGGDQSYVERLQSELRFALQRAESAEGERAAMQDQLRDVQDQLQRHEQEQQA
jgi:hypothetical protein